MDWPELLKQVEDSVLTESLSELQELAAQISEVNARPPRPRCASEDPPVMVQKSHGFVEWLQALQVGWSNLPVPIPHTLLVAWKNGHKNHPVPGGTPIPYRRCTACLVALSNCTEEGFGPCLSPCPVCGSTKIAWRDLSKPWETAFILGRS